MKMSRPVSFLVLALIYLAAAIIGILIHDLDLCGGSILWNLFVADAVATVFVWMWGLVFKNVSVYDPYWSVAPPVMLTACAAAWGSWNMAACLLLAAVWFWAVRLTANWAVTFKGMAFEDWRYTKYRTEQPAWIFQIINFFGLNMMPTVVVFLCMAPGIEILNGVPGSANVLTWLSLAICLAAACLQLVADTQSHSFRRGHRGQVCNVGLWKHGRHPNYLGEILMWWGVWLMYVSVAGIKEKPWLVAGPVLMTCMFRFISVPLMENRQLKNKPGYAEYRKSTRMFI